MLNESGIGIIRGYVFRLIRRAFLISILIPATEEYLFIKKGNLPKDSWDNFFLYGHKLFCWIIPKKNSTKMILFDFAQQNQIKSHRHKIQSL